MINSKKLRELRRVLGEGGVTASLVRGVEQAESLPFPMACDGVGAGSREGGRERTSKMIIGKVAARREMAKTL